MESSHVFVDTEKCSSSESGWTMYLTSPPHHGDDDDHCDDEEHDDDEDATGYDARHEDSDDSLASDASSGPSRPEHSYGSGEDRHNMAHFKHEKGEHKIKSYSYEKSYNQMEKKRNEEAKVEDKDGTSATTVQTRGKVRKTNWMSKRK